MTRKLHIGGEMRTPGWEVLNIIPGEHVDHLCDASDLSIFGENTFSEIYASHIVEHLDYIEELNQSLVDWNRVLIPGGKLYISVPDLDILSHLFLKKEEFNMEERFQIMRMIFGGHTDDYDYHVVGLNEEFLSFYLSEAGFVKLQKVERFGIFNDTSNMDIKGNLISLNMIAEKPELDI